MAAQNFKIKNGLTVGTTEVIDSSGDLTAAAFGTAANEAIDDQVNTLLTAGTGVSLSYDDSAGTLTINGQQGDVTGVTAGDGLTGGGSSGDVTLAVQVDDSSIEIDSDTLRVKASGVTNAMLGGSIANSKLANSSVTVNSNSLSLGGSLTLDTDDIGEGSSNVYFTNERVDDRVNALLTAGTGVSLTYDDAANTLTIDGQVGDITGVTAGTNLSGGGTSGTVTLNVEQKLNNTTAPYYHNVVVTVSGGKFLFDGQTSSQSLRLMPSIVYRFDQSDSSNGSHPLRFSESEDGTEMSDGYTIYNKVGTPGSSGAYTEVAFDQEAPSIMYFYCSNHSGMGNSVYLGDESGDIAGVTAGDGLSGGGTSGTVSLALDLNELTAATVDPSADSIAIIDGGSSNVSRKESIADLATMMAGDGLSASSGAFAVNVDDSSIETSSDSLQVKAGGITNAMLAGSITNAKLTNSTITIAGASTALGGTVLADTDALSEGSSNLYFTNERVDDRVAALIVGGSNITATYDDAAGTLTLAGSAAYTDGDARQAISVTDSGGDGALAYNNSTGVITYTGPSATEVRTHFSGGTGVSISSGEVSIGQAVATNSNVQFANLTLSGNLTVNGTTTTVSSTNTVVSDTLLELGNGTSGSPSNDAGLVIERGSSDNVFIGWDESADAITFGTGSFTGASTGNLTITPSAVNTGAVTITNATNSGGTARNVYQSTSAPTSSDGAVGDLWILYS